MSLQHLAFAIASLALSDLESLGAGAPSAAGWGGSPQLPLAVPAPRPAAASGAHDANSLGGSARIPALCSNSTPPPYAELDVLVVRTQTIFNESETGLSS